MTLSRVVTYLLGLEPLFDVKEPTISLISLVYMGLGTRCIFYLQHTQNYISRP